MNTDVKLLPLPDRHIVGQPCYFGSQMQAYARANMEPLLRDRDSLRSRLEDAVRDLTDAKAENERLREDLNAYASMVEIESQVAKEAEAKAERLAEALRELSEICRAAIKAGDWKVDGACDPDSLLSRADAAIDQARGKGGAGK